MNYFCDLSSLDFFKIISFVFCHVHLFQLQLAKYLFEVK